MNDDPYKAPESGPEEPQRSAWQSKLPARVAVVLWCCVGGAGALMLSLIVSAHLAGVGYHMQEVSIAVCVLLLSAVGLKFRWGTTIPCTIFGFLVCMSIIRRHVPITDVIHWPILAAGLGAGFGWVIDSFRVKQTD